MTVQGHTPFQGTTYSVVHNAKTLAGILSVEVVQTGGAKAEMKDITDSDVAVYTYIADALGSKGAGQVAINVLCQVTSVFETGEGPHAIALNSPQTTVITFQPAVTLGSVFTDSVELTSRTTTIPWGGICTVALVFEASGAGAWTSPVVA